MYAGIVRSRVRRIFAAINRADPQPMLDGLAPDFSYRFHGDHALGGTRTTAESLRLWWDRIFRLLPGVTFEVLDVVVDGAPWHTRLAVRLRVAGLLPDGQTYQNTVFQFMTLRWGKVTSIEMMEDLQLLEHALAVVAASGQDEARAAPITDPRA